MENENGNVIISNEKVSFLKKNWLNILSGLIGIAGFVFGIYAYMQSIKEREPIFIVDKNRTEILNKNNISKVPIKVIKKNGEEIKSSLTSVKIYFWNDGKEPIKRDNILRDIKITIEDTSAEIIDYKILKVSREITEIRLLPDSVKPKTTLNINFKILEQSDGFTAQILYIGNSKANISISGFLEGVKNIDNNAFDNNYGYAFFMYFFRQEIGGIIGVFIVLIPFYLLFKKYQKINEKRRESLVKKYPESVEEINKRWKDMSNEIIYFPFLNIKFKINFKSLVIYVLGLILLLTIIIFVSAKQEFNKKFDINTVVPIEIITNI